MSDKLIGFLSPDGEFIKCNECEHIAVATEILNKNGMTKNCSADIYLANMGWMLFQQSFAGIPAEVRPVPQITDKQVDWIINNYDKINRKQRYFISEKLKFDEINKKRVLPQGIDNVPFTGLI